MIITGQSRLFLPPRVALDLKAHAVRDRVGRAVLVLQYGEYLGQEQQTEGTGGGEEDEHGAGDEGEGGALAQ